MAVAISLKDIVDFQENHGGAGYDVRRDPVAHYYELFGPLFAVRHTEPRVSPVLPLTVVLHFLRSTTGTFGWFQYRLRWYLWARRRVAAFLRQAVGWRRARLQRAFQQWEEHEAKVRAEEDTSLAQDLKPHRSRRDLTQVPIAPRARVFPAEQKRAAIASLHRAKVRAWTLDCRSAVRHRRQLVAELKTVSRHLAYLWLQGSFRGLAVQQRAARLFGLRQRLRTYFVEGRSLDQLWEEVPVPEMMLEALKLFGEGEEPLTEAEFMAAFAVDITALPSAMALGEAPFSPQRRRYRDAVESALEINGVEDHVTRLQWARNWDEHEPCLPSRLLSFSGALYVAETQTDSPPASPPTVPELAEDGPASGESAAPSPALGPLAGPIVGDIAAALSPARRRMESLPELDPPQPVPLSRPKLNGRFGSHSKFGGHGLSLPGEECSPRRLSSLHDGSMRRISGASTTSNTTTVVAAATTPTATTPTATTPTAAINPPRVPPRRLPRNRTVPKLLKGVDGGAADDGASPRGVPAALDAAGPGREAGAASPRRPGLAPSPSAGDLAALLPSFARANSSAQTSPLNPQTSSLPGSFNESLLDLYELAGEPFPLDCGDATAGHRGSGIRRTTIERQPSPAVALSRMELSPLASPQPVHAGQAVRLEHLFISPFGLPELGLHDSSDGTPEHSPVHPGRIRPSSKKARAGLKTGRVFTADKTSTPLGPAGNPLQVGPAPAFHRRVL